MNSRFTHRSSDVEVMDDLSCSGEVVSQTLRELEIINRTLGGNNVTLNGLQQLMTANPSQKTFTIADLGCGGGDILKRVAEWGAENEFVFHLTGIDANPNIIAIAQKNTRGYSNIHYKTVNVLSKEFQEQKFDVILATLFMHHFSDDQLIDMLKGLKQQAQTGVVINDIHRHWFAYHSVQWLTKLFSNSAMVKIDAPLSVLRAFKRPELESILERAGIKTYSLRWSWAFRWRLVVPAY